MNLKEIVIENTYTTIDYRSTNGKIFNTEKIESLLRLQGGSTSAIEMSDFNKKYSYDVSRSLWIEFKIYFTLINSNSAIPFICIVFSKFT